MDAQPPPPQGGPQGPGPTGPQSPGPQSPGSQSPGRAPAYGGPVPPGGWEQPIARQGGWSGQLAGWGARAGAYVIDIVILLVPFGVITGVLVGAGALAFGEDSDAGIVAVIATAILLFLVLAVIWFLYAPLLMMRSGRHNGQTWGKQLMSIRAVRDNGQPFSFGSAALREVVLKNLAVGIASSIIPLIPWFLNFFWPLWDDQNRALHDMAASTHVVRA